MLVVEVLCHCTGWHHHYNLYTNINIAINTFDKHSHKFDQYSNQKLFVLSLQFVTERETVCIMTVWFMVVVSEYLVNVRIRIKYQ